MTVEIMMFGGHRDGQILEVPGKNGIPDSKIVAITMYPKDRMGRVLEYDKKIINLDIVPRTGKPGPKWKIELPKELW